MVEPVGLADGAPSDLVGEFLRNKKKLAFISWTMNIGAYGLCGIIYAFFYLIEPILTLI